MSQNDLPGEERPSVQQLEKELAELREFQRTTFEFLHLFCNYIIKSPVLSILSTTKLLLTPQMSDENPGAWLHIITQNGVEIHKAIDAVLDAARYERKDLRHSYEEIFFEHYKSEQADLRQALQKAISQVREKVDFENEMQARSNELANALERILSPESEAIRLNINIPDNLPTVIGNPVILEQALADIAWFITNRFMLRKIAFEVGFNDDRVSLIISCTTLASIDQSPDLFQQFDAAPTFLVLDPRSLFLYNSRRILKLYDTQMKFNVEENGVTDNSSKISVTIVLPRHKVTES
jgi:hypothetical protein